MRTHRSNGFTLIEAAVAIAVIAILSGIIVPLVVKNIRDSQQARAKNDVQVIAAALASQLKDTGNRPTQGVANATQNWVSGPNGGATPAVTGFTATSTTANTFTALFNANANAGNALFGTTANAELSYRGPYLANDISAKVDPWNHRYFVLGYNKGGATANGPIYVVCAGPDGAVNAANLTAPNGPANGQWNTTGASADDIFVRVN